jgi:hypothetical protein
VTQHTLPKLSVALAVIAVATVLLSAFGKISLFLAIPVMVIVFVVGFTLRHWHADEPRKNKRWG